MNDAIKYMALYALKTLPTLPNVDDWEEIPDLHARESSAATVFSRFDELEKKAGQDTVLNYFSLTINYPLNGLTQLHFKLFDVSKCLRRLTNGMQTFCGVSNRDYFQKSFKLGGARVVSVEPTNDYPVVQIRYLLATPSEDVYNLPMELHLGQLYWRLKKINPLLTFEFREIGSSLTDGKVIDLLFPPSPADRKPNSFGLVGKHVRRELMKINPRPHFLGALYKRKSATDGKDTG